MARLSTRLPASAGVLLSLVMGLLPVSVSCAAGLPGPMPATWAKSFAAVRQDPPPKEIVRNTHYVISNEDHPDRFHQAIRSGGGVYIGVGSEQNYVLAGWARPEVLVLMDFDQIIVDLHRVYRVFFLHAQGPREFIDLWDERHETEALRLIAAAYPQEPVRASVVRAYRISRYAVRRRLPQVMALCREGGVRSFLDDAGQYAYLAALFRGDRVILLRGDLTLGGTTAGLGVAAAAAGLPVRVLYLSNTERYFPYGGGFKGGMLALPMDDGTLVLRTSARKEGSYEYTVQGGRNFQDWLKKPQVQWVRQILRAREKEGGTWFVRRPPTGPHPATM